MPVLAAGTVHLWWAEHRFAEASWTALLNPAEHSRYHAYRCEADRTRFLTGVVMVRRLFAAELGIDPAAVRLDRQCLNCQRPHGKVRLGGEPSGAGPEVSLSHSGRWVVLAATRGCPVGVDVERIAPGLDYAGASRLALSRRESEQLLRLPVGDRVPSFTRSWTRKEAVLKAIGEGLRSAPSGLEVTPADSPAAIVAWPARPELTGRLQLTDLACPKDYRAAVAVLDPAGPLDLNLRQQTELLGPTPGLDLRSTRDG
jgi:4'-phosphopantetheinyl transferase